MERPWTVEELVEEFDQPKLTGWKLFAQTTDVKVYRRADENNKFSFYKCYSHIPDVSPEIFYQVALDFEYRLVWDDFLKEANEIQDEEKTGVYWQIKMPLFIDNRDYTFVRDYGEYDIDNRHFHHVLTRSEEFRSIPTRKKVIRIENYIAQTLLCSDGAKGLRSFFIYCEDPRGNLPKAVWSWAAKFGVPMYAKLTHNACLAYPDWLKNKKAKQANLTDDETRATTTASNPQNELVDD